MKPKFNLWDFISALTVLIFAVLLRKYREVSSELSTEASKLNNTAKANQTVLVFNRTPKAGSESLWELIGQISHLLLLSMNWPLGGVVKYIDCFIVRQYF